MSKIARVHCGTKKCTGFVDANVEEAPKSVDGIWQFQCPVCRYWSVLSRTGVVKETSPEPFDLERPPSHLRDSYRVVRSPSGGV